MNIERGRHTRPKTPVEQRLCLFCKSLENEIHFVIDCASYKTEREIFFINVIAVYPDFDGLNSMDRFKYLFTSNNPNVLTWLGKFIYNSLQTRSKRMNDGNITTATLID